MPKESGQQGFMLLEVLVSVLLFALGIVALVGLQARSLVTTDDTRYRAEAAHLADAYVGKIWAAAGGLPGAQIVAQFSTGGGAEYTDFSNQVLGGGPNSYPGIPGAIAPTVNIADLSPAYTSTAGLVNLPSVDVTIIIQWDDQEKVRHTYRQISSVGLSPI